MTGAAAGFRSIPSSGGRSAPLYNMKTRIPQFGMAVMLAASMAFPSIAQDTGQDMKSAGRETKQAVKDAGRGISHGAKTTGRKVKHGSKRAVHSGAKATENGASKVEKRTSDNTKH